MPLTREQADAQLKGLRGEWLPAQIKALQALPSSARRVGRFIAGLKPDTDGETDWQENRNLWPEMVRGMVSLPDQLRNEMFGVLFAGLAPLVQAGFQLKLRMPFQTGYMRRPFRAPARPELYGGTQLDWLQGLHTATRGYSQDVVWFARWAPWLSGYKTAECLGILFAAAIENGNREVFDVLVASARAEEEVGGMGRHVTRGLLCSSNPEGWEVVSKLLLAAQREEGLRQVILETVDECHPDALRRMLATILEHDLARFSSVVRALGTWMALPWDSVSVKVVNSTLGRLVQYLDDDKQRVDVLASAEWEPWYEAAWVEAFQNAPRAAQIVAAGLKHQKAEMRYTAAYLGVQLHLPEIYPLLAESLADTDERVADRVGGLFGADDESAERVPDLFERAEAQMPRWRDDKEPGKPITWPWSCHKLERAELCQVMLNSLGSRSPTRMLPYFDHLNPNQRANLCKRLMDTGGAADEQVRALILKMVSDRSSVVREAAVDAVSKFVIKGQEANELELLLQRKTPDLRRAMLTLLLKQDDASVLEGAKRLVACRNEMQRLGGLELLRQLIKQERAVAQSRIAAEDFRSTAKNLTRSEEVQLEQLLSTQAREATLDDALGLADVSTFPVPQEPKPRPALYMSATAIGLIEGIDKLAEKHAQTIVKTDGRGEYAEQPLGNLGRWGFPTPGDGPVQDQLSRWPLREVWEEFFAAHSKAVRDPDGLELPRACFYMKAVWPYNNDSLFYEQHKVKYRGVIHGVLTWLGRLHPNPAATNYLLDCVENALALHKVADLAVNPGEHAHKFTWDNGFVHAVFDWAWQHRHWHPDLWSQEQFSRLWNLLLWRDQQKGERRFAYINTDDMLRALDLGLITEDTFIFFLIGGRKLDPDQRHGYAWSDYSELRSLSGRKPDPKLNISSTALASIEQCRQRILEVELVRGDQPTAATRPALALRYTGGLETLARVVRAMDRRKIRRDSSWGSSSHSRDYVFSQFIRNTWPGGQDTPEAFAKALPAKDVGEERLLEVAMFAPHWARHVEHALKWKGLSDAIWWVHAHTKDDNWSVEQEVREAWHAWMSERTPLSAADLTDGGVDVAWFNRVIGTLGRKKFEQVLEVAKLAASGSGHARAKLFANAMLANVKRAELVGRIKEKRHQDSVRALGLLPLSKGKAAEKDVLDRYKVMQEFLRTRRQFGSQRQASEKRAAEIGLENLARTAGYPDPQRLEWAMEAKAVADLAKGPVTVKRGEVEVSLSLDTAGNPELTVVKKGKPLKAVPPALKKDPAIAELAERKTDLKRQASRMRQSLEAAMLRGDEFTGGELRKLFEHPILAPMLSQLVLIVDKHAGYPEKQGRLLRNHEGKIEPVDVADRLRIAHAYDLFKARQWHAWQKDCFAREMIQPFKQVFRELYVLTEAETSSEHFTRRYSGQQVHPRQALVLLGGRGWVSRPEEGVSKTFHREGLTAWVGFLEGFYTPAEVEGLTVENVAFSKRDQWEPMKLKDVPPSVFSEVMRDVDLMVSVAHRGEVDPEASASTIELRTAIARETLALLKLKNVTFDGRYAMIKGHYSDYSVHLGSGIVHRMPGSMVCIIPVHAQHRGRLFLPFADDDPKSAEVLSKILMLAKDAEIRDPNILDQLRH